MERLIKTRKGEREMNDYKEMLVTLNKKVKQLDRIHNAVRKNGNEFAMIQMQTTDDNYSHFIKNTEHWDSPKIEMDSNRRLTLTPDYWFEIHYDRYSNWIDWSPKIVTEDMNSSNGRHRPVVIIRSLWETSADFLFIYTKKTLFEYIRDINNEPAFNNLILGERWERRANHFDKFSNKKVDRVMKDEFDLLEDDDVIFITATGDDQEDGINIKSIDYWNKRFVVDELGTTMSSRKQESFNVGGTNWDSEYETDLNDLLQGLCSLDNNSEMFNLG